MSKMTSVFRKLWRPSQSLTRLSLVDSSGGRKPERPFSWKEFAGGLLTSFRSPVFIPSVFGDSGGLLMDRRQVHTRRMEAALLSIIVHASIILLAVLMVRGRSVTLTPRETTVIIGAPLFDLPTADAGGGGGGGGGRQEPLTQAWGHMPFASKFQLLAPDPKEPQPLIPPDDALSVTASIVMPIDLPQDQYLPVGDLTAPPSSSRSSGPGSGNGIGTGDGSGIGPGKGSGYGPGENGGTGGGRQGTIGNGGNGVYGPGTAGLRYPEVLVDPKPEYTEEARKSRTEGILLIQAIIRKDGSVDSFHVIHGLGHGLDESAIQTIGRKWRFRPGRLNGVNVDVLANIEVSFRLF